MGVWAWWIAARAWYVARATEDSLGKLVKEPPPGLAKLTKLEAELTEHTDSLEALHVMLRKLRARITMRDNREKKRNSESDIPDPLVDPVGYKTYMRAKLRQGKL